MGKGAKNIVLIPNLLLLLMFFGKFSTFTSGFAFCILFCIFDVLFRKNWKSIWLFLPGIILMPVCYLVYCPSIKNLFEYVAGILKISSGWMLTMQFDSDTAAKRSQMVNYFNCVLCIIDNRESVE